MNESISGLILAGMVAGAMNAVAGGGTFVALPVLALAGLPPTIANASTTVALFPGTLASVWAYHKDMTSLENFSTPCLLLLGLSGGLFGALLVAAANGAAVICFVATRNVSWPACLAVMLGGILGGYIGARAAWRLSARAVGTLSGQLC